MRTISSMILSWTSNIAQLFSVSITISRLTVRLSAFSKEHLSFARSTPPSSSSAIFVMTYPWRHQQAFYISLAIHPAPSGIQQHGCYEADEAVIVVLTSFFIRSNVTCTAWAAWYLQVKWCTLSYFQALRYRCWALGSYKYLHSRLFKICTTEPNYSNFMHTCILCSC